MGQLWLPGSEIRQAHSGLVMAGGPNRVVHHITYDSLHADGTRIITLDGVTNYLLSKHYEPHLVIDPFTGEAISCLPADEGGFALLSGNRSGDVCYQIEWLFTPGTVYNGVRYDSLADTPMAGLDLVLALADSWGIPRGAPLSPGDRNSNVWNNTAGHYGHFNVPGNDHSDPVCSIQDILDRAGSGSVITKESDPEMFIIQDPTGTHSWKSDGLTKTYLSPIGFRFWEAAGIKNLGPVPADEWVRIRNTDESWAYVGAAATKVLRSDKV